MNNKNANKSQLYSKLGIPAAVLLSYVSALCALPSCGFFTSLPIAPVLAVVISFFCKQRNIIYISMAFMHFITPLLFGYGVKTCVISTLTALLLSYLAILAKRALITVKKSDNKNVVAKSKTVLTVTATVCVILWLVCCGNPVSFFIAENSNIKTAEEKYPGKLETGATYFDLSRFEYVTEITFNGKDEGGKYYISSGRTDDYLRFHMAETLLDAVSRFSGKTALPESTLVCYIDKDEFIFGQSGEYNANFKNAEYLMERAEAVTGMKGFKDLYNNLMEYAKQSDDLVYKSITVTAKGIDGKTYYAYKEYGTDTVFSTNNKELEKSLKEKFN